MKCSAAGLNTAAVASLNTWLAFNWSWPLSFPLSVSKGSEKPGALEHRYHQHNTEFVAYI